MPDDLIARLRAHALDRIWSEDLYDEAADRLEELTQTLTQLEDENRQQRALIRSSGQEINRLRDLIPEPS